MTASSRILKASSVSTDTISFDSLFQCPTTILAKKKRLPKPNSTLLHDKLMLKTPTSIHFTNLKHTYPEDNQHAYL